MKCAACGKEIGKKRVCPFCGEFTSASTGSTPHSTDSVNGASASGTSGSSHESTTGEATSSSTGASKKGPVLSDEEKRRKTDKTIGVTAAVASAVLLVVMIVRGDLLWFLP